MALFAEFAALCRQVAAAAGRLQKRRLVAEYLGRLPPGEACLAVTYLTGRPFPPSDPRALNARDLPEPVGSATGPPLALAEVAEAFAAVAGAGGPGARQVREARLAALAARVPAAEREILGRIVRGELRIGVSDGLVLEAIAGAAGADPAAVRRAVLALGDPAAVARLALGEGPGALERIAPRPLVYHLAVRDGEGWAEIGKTFKGLTDREFAAMTARLRGLALADDGYTVRVRPEVVVEVAYNEIQQSPTYRSGLALRFARITRIREDKAPGQATTLEALRGLYERQFATKGRGGRSASS